jgi:hypothetical protein
MLNAEKRDSHPVAGYLDSRIGGEATVRKEVTIRKEATIRNEMTKRSFTCHTFSFRPAIPRPMPLAQRAPPPSPDAVSYPTERVTFAQSHTGDEGPHIFFFPPPNLTPSTSVLGIPFFFTLM